MSNETLRERIVEILGRYRVQKHYRATTEAKRPRYAVFTGTQLKGDLRQIGEPMSSLKAELHRRELTARDIEQLVQDPAMVMDLMRGNDR